jgi:hypothetical protein
MGHSQTRFLMFMLSGETVACTVQFIFLPMSIYLRHNTVAYRRQMHVDKKVNIVHQRQA